MRPDSFTICMTSLQQSTNGDQMANRGKILMLRKKIEELESQVDNKDSELKNKVRFSFQLSQFVVLVFSDNYA